MLIQTESGAQGAHGPALLDDFIRLSAVLTGERSLARQLAKDYLQILQQRAEPVEQLVEAFRQLPQTGGALEEAVRQQLVLNPKHQEVVRKVLLLWYVGGVYAPDPDEPKRRVWLYEKPEHYFGGLVWSAARAHPPALSGGYFGHWRYPPEN